MSLCGFFTITDLGIAVDTVSMLLWSVLFSAIGLGYFIYGKRQQALAPLCTGLALFIFPYFMTSVTTLLIVGAVLVTIPYFFRS